MSKDLEVKGDFKNELKGKIAVFLLRMIASLGFGFCQAFGSFTGRIIYSLNTREVKVARINLELCYPELEGEEKEDLIKKIFINNSKMAYETAYIWFNDPSFTLTLMNKEIGGDYLASLDGNPKGNIVILPHIGNWEVLNTFIMDRIKNSSAMYTPSKLPAVEALMLKGRQQTGLKLEAANPKGVIGLYKKLKQGGTLLILPDQEPDRANGEFAPLFGIPALTMTMISKLAAKSGAEIALAYAPRMENGKFDFVFEKAPDGINDKDLATSVTALNVLVEDCIRRHPEQYMWGYKRFRARPDGEPSFYAKIKK